MSPEQQAALDKIKKLLRMRRGGTAGEVETALAMAARIAREHDIDLNAVNPDDEHYERPIGHSSVPYGARVINFFNVSVVIVEKFSARSAWMFRGQARFVADYIGTEWDIEVGRFIFHFLVGHFRRSWRLRDNKRLRNRQAFFHGMFIGISSKLREECKPEPRAPGLVPVHRSLDIRRAYLDKLHPNSTQRPLPDDAYGSRVAGYYAGRNTIIPRGGLKPAPEPATPGSDRKLL